MTERAAAPRRVLVLSADIGEGHNATARAVEERARALWPECDIRRVDTLEVMAHSLGPVSRWVYQVNVNSTPWLYDAFYRALWRHRRSCDLCCRAIGLWSGRRLEPLIAGYRPDLVVSTYPLGAAGLNWIRRRGGLEVPVATMIPDFAPHPFWIYSEIDMHFVVSEPSLRALRRARPGARGTVGGLPVVAAFAPCATQAATLAARRRLGLPTDRPIVLITCGAFGFGSVDRAVSAAMRASRQACVVVACGRNEALAARLDARGEPADRLHTLRWTTQMPTVTAAADVVVSNGGGASALEAIASGRAALLFDPIAGHGRANADVMKQAGLARVCRDEAALVAGLQHLLLQPASLAQVQQRAVAFSTAHDLQDVVAALPRLPRWYGPHRLPAADAFFVHAESAAVPQQVGAMLMLDDRDDPLGPPERLAKHIAGLVTDRTPDLPMLRRRLERGPGRWPRWPRWLPVDEVDPARHITARTVGSEHDGWSSAVQEFFATPVALDRPPWQVQVLYDSVTRRTAVLAAVHHALGDGLAVTATLVGLFSDHPGPQPQPAGQTRTPADARGRLARAGRQLRGLVSLAMTGSASYGSSTARSSPGRSFGMFELPAGPMRAAARAHGVSTTAVLLALVGETLQRYGVDPAQTRAGRVRAMIPRTTRAVRRAGDGGNHTSAVSLRLPVCPMSRGARIAEVAAALDTMERTGQPVAARTVVVALGYLPAPLHALVVRLIYRRRFFELIASVMPGPRRVHHVLGARVATVYPVLPLAEGVGLGVGFLSWADTIGVAVTTDAGLLPDAPRFADLLRQSADELLGESAAAEPHRAAGVAHPTRPR